MEIVSETTFPGLLSKGKLVLTFLVCFFSYSKEVLSIKNHEPSGYISSKMKENWFPYE